jgi:hypothetical protein
MCILSFVADIYIQNYIFLENEITHNINNGFNKKKESSPRNYNGISVDILRASNLY